MSVFFAPGLVGMREHHHIYFQFASPVINPVQILLDPVLMPMNQQYPHPAQGNDFFLLVPVLQIAVAGNDISWNIELLGYIFAVTVKITRKQKAVRLQGLQASQDWPGNPMCICHHRDDQMLSPSLNTACRSARALFKAWPR